MGRRHAGVGDQRDCDFIIQQQPRTPWVPRELLGVLGAAVAMSVAIQRPKRAKSAPKQNGPSPCKSTLGGFRGMEPPKPTAQITQRDSWGVCELHRTTRGTSNKPTTAIVILRPG